MSTETIEGVVTEETTNKRMLKTWKCADKSVDCEMPEGFTFEEYKPLVRRAFTHDKFYWGHRVQLLQGKLDHAIEQRDYAAKFGSKDEQKKAAKRIKMQAKMQELQKTLEASGIDISALLAKDEE